MTDHHYTHPEGFTEDGDQVWRCLICKYRVQLGVGTCMILNRGDPNATHSGGAGGLVIGGVEAEDPDWLAAFRKWAEGRGE